MEASFRQDRGVAWPLHAQDYGFGAGWNLGQGYFKAGAELNRLGSFDINRMSFRFRTVSDQHDVESFETAYACREAIWQSGTRSIKANPRDRLSIRPAMG